MSREGERSSDGGPSPSLWATGQLCPPSRTRSRSVAVAATHSGTVPRFPNRRSALGPGGEAHEHAGAQIGHSCAWVAATHPISARRMDSTYDMLALRSEGRVCGDPSPPNWEGRLAMRFFRSWVLFVAATGSLVAGGSLVISDVAPAGASPAVITVHCPTDNLQTAINNAVSGSTLLVNGTCTGNFSITRT